MSQKHTRRTLQLSKILICRLRKGSCVFVTGPSGAGKTTLLKLLCAAKRSLPRAKILINGKNVIQLNSRGVARLRQQMGLVFQEFKFLPHMTALDNVALAGLVVGAPRGASYNKAYHLLRELGLEKKYNAKPLALSGGEQQRVAIARALMNDPIIVLADEPTENLDAELADETMRLFLKSRERGTTIMVASHDLDFSQRYRTRVISLHEGCLVDDSKPQQRGSHRVKRSQLGLVGRRVCSSLRVRLWTHVLIAGTMAIVLFVFGAFLLVQENLQNLLTGWGDQIQINAYLDKDLRAEEVAVLRDKIQSLSEVERIRHISREQAWKDFRAALGAHSNVLEGLPEDVLPASFEIFIKPAYRDGPIVEAFANRLRKAKGTYHRRVFRKNGSTS